MFLKKLNNITLEKYSRLYEILLGILASILVFIKPGTFGIFLFVAFNLLFYKKIKWNSSKLRLITIIAIPFLLNVLFIWNNDSIYEGVKHGEKYISMILFPALIIGQSYTISIKRVLKTYTFLFTIILTIAFLLHLFLNLDSFKMYLSGAMVWQMGYKFALSMNTHAPALNIHVAFLVVVNYYLMLTSFFEDKNRKIIAYRILFFLLSIFILFIINTRLAVLNAFIGIFIISIAQGYKKMSKRELLILISKIMVLLFIITISFVKIFPYVIDKYTKVTFNHMDKIGKLDEFKNPEAEVYNALVTRLSIWKTVWETSQDHLFFGVGAADSKKVLNQAYIDSNQKFLSKYKFPTHNQYLDFLLKFGIIGLIGALVYIFYFLWIANKTRSALVLFFFILFFASNITDDFLIIYDGITFSALWISIFTNDYYYRFRKHEEANLNSFHN